MRQFPAALAALALLNGIVSAGEVHVYPGDNFETAAESLQPGDTLIVHAGTYEHSGRLAVTVKGTQQQPVVITGADGEVKPVISLTASGQNVVNIDGASWLTLRHLEITGNGFGGADGVNMHGSPSHITLEDLTIHNVSVGINFRSSMSHIWVRRNHIYNTNDTGEGIYVGCHDGSCAVSDSIIEFNWIHDTTNADQGDGIEIKRGSHSNIVRDNVVHDTKYPCILLYGTDGNPRNIVERNVVWNCADAGIQVAADTIVRNNIVLAGLGRGIASQSHAGVNPNNLEIVHNTIVGGSPCVHASGWNDKTGMVFANNAVYCASGNYSFQGLSGVTMRGNVFEPLPLSVPSATNTAGRSEAQDFVEHAARNVYPTSDSALLSAGQADYVTDDDFNGTARTNGIDAGAYAWMGATNPGWAVTAGFKDSAAPDLTLAFSADPADVAHQGQSTLIWTASNADTCTAGGAWSGSKPLSGSESTGPLMEDASYSLECIGSDGSISRTVTVTVAKADEPPAPPDTETPEGASGSGTMNWYILLLLACAVIARCTSTSLRARKAR